MTEDASIPDLAERALSELSALRQELSELNHFCRMAAHGAKVRDGATRRLSLSASDLEFLQKSLSAFEEKYVELYYTLSRKLVEALVIGPNAAINTHG